MVFDDINGGAGAVQAGVSDRGLTAGDRRVRDPHQCCRPRPAARDHPRAGRLDSADAPLVRRPANTINLIDGVDGLAAGVVAIVAATLLLAAINRGETDIVILSGALIGAASAFSSSTGTRRGSSWRQRQQLPRLHAGRAFRLSVAKGAVVFALIVPVLALRSQFSTRCGRSCGGGCAGVRSPHRTTGHLHHRLLEFRAQPRARRARLLLRDRDFCRRRSGHLRAQEGLARRHPADGAGSSSSCLRRFRRISRG